MLGAQGEPGAAGDRRRTFAQAPAPASPARQKRCHDPNPMLATQGQGLQAVAVCVSAAWHAAIQPNAMARLRE